MVWRLLAVAFYASLFASSWNLWGAQEAFAGDSSACPNIRLDQGNGPVAPIPTYDQEDKNICYAIVASELVDAYRFSSPDANRKQLTSYLVTASHFSGMYRETLNKMPGVQRTDGLELGTPYWAILALKAEGSCDQNQLFKDPATAGIDKNLSDLNRIIGRYRAFRETGLQAADPSSVSCLNARGTEFSDNLALFQSDIEKIFSSQKFYRCVDDFLNEVCKPFKIPLTDLPAPKYVTFVNSKTD